MKKEKRRLKIAEKKNLLKRKKKLDEEKFEEKELCGKLNELNNEFQTINNIKKKQQQQQQQKECLRQYQNNF